MRILRKINKGLVLTIIVLAILTIYLIHVERIRKEQEPEVKKACEEYISMINNNIVMPEEYLKFNSEITTNENIKNSIEDKIINAVKEKTIDNKMVSEIETSQIMSFINDNNKETKFVTSYKKEITKFNRIKFEGDQVSVSFNSKIEYNVKYIENPEEVFNLYNIPVSEEESNMTKESNKIERISDTASFYGEEKITLKKVDGKWKVVSSDIMLQNYANNISGGFLRGNLNF